MLLTLLMVKVKAKIGCVLLRVLLLQRWFKSSLMLLPLQMLEGEAMIAGMLLKNLMLDGLIIRYWLLVARAGCNGVSQRLLHQRQVP